MSMREALPHPARITTRFLWLAGWGGVPHQFSTYLDKSMWAPPPTNQPGTIGETLRKMTFAEKILTRES